MLAAKDRLIVGDGAIGCQDMYRNQGRPLASPRCGAIFHVAGCRRHARVRLVKRADWRPSDLSNKTREEYKQMIRRAVVFPVFFSGCVLMYCEVFRGMYLVHSLYEYDTHCPWSRMWVHFRDTYMCLSQILRNNKKKSTEYGK